MASNSYQKYPPAFLYKIIERFRHDFLRRLRLLTIPQVTIMETIQSFYVSRAMGVAAELNIAEILKSGEKTVKDLSIQTNTNEEALYRLLRMLASQGIFKEKKNRVFSQNRLSKVLTDDSSSMRHMVMHQINTANWDMFGELDYVVKTGNSAASKVLKKDIFEHLEQNPELNDLYNKAMHNTSEMLSNAVLSAYNFNKNQLIIDIGGGHGLLLSKIVANTKYTKGIVFDLPHVVEGAENTLEELNLSDRIKIAGGSFYENIPQGGHIYIMKNIIHALGNDDSVELLKKISEAMSYNGKILIIEPIIEKHNRYSFAKLYDIQMLVGRSEGKERTVQEYEVISKKAGLKINRIKQTVSPFSIIELIKA